MSSQVEFKFCQWGLEYQGRYNTDGLATKLTLVDNTNAWALGDKMSEDFPLEPNLTNVRRLDSPPWTMDPFPFNQVMNGDGPCPFDPFTLRLETERTENPYRGLLFQATENYHQGNFKTALTYLNQV